MERIVRVVPPSVYIYDRIRMVWHGWGVWEPVYLELCLRTMESMALALSGGNPIVGFSTGSRGMGSEKEHL